MIGIFGWGRILAVLAVILALVGGGYWWGSTAESNARDAKELKMQKAAKIAYDAKVVDFNEISDQLEVAKHERTIVTRTITERVNKYVDRPIYRNECLDTDGLRDADAALIGKSGNTGEPAATVPPADTAKR